MRSLHLLWPALFLTGAAALAEEVLWMRMLRRLIGSTSGTAAVVLAGILGGMALGSWVGDRALPRVRRPLAGWALATAASGAAALLLGGLLGFLERLDAVPRGASPVLFVLVTAAAVPLGAGFPFAVAALGSERAPSLAGPLYGVNSLGGALGALATPLLLLPGIGERSTLVLAASIQLAVGGAGLGLLRGAPLPSGPFPGADRSPGRRDAPGLSSMALVLLSGVAVISWEVLWTRILVLVVGSSVHAFALVAGGVVLGIGAGSLLIRAGPLHAAGRLPTLLPGAVLLILSAGYFGIPRLPDAYLQLARLLGGPSHWWGAVGAGALALIACAPLGLIFPWALARSPLRAGALAAASGAGAAGGALLGGPLLLGRLGLEPAYLAGLLAVGAVAACGALAGRGGGRRSVWPPVLGAALLPLIALLGGLLSGGWDLPRLLSGVYQWPADYITGRDPGAREREVLAIEEGREAVVSVERDGNTVFVKANGKVEGSVPADPALPSRADLPTQLLLGTLPALLSPGGSAGVIGLGSGTTLGAAHRAGLAPIDLLEIEPAFERAITAPGTASYFAPFLHRALESSQVERFTGDARSLLRGALAGRRWDVLVSQPSEPWLASSAALFTTEFFALASRRLAPEGIFCQWVQLYKLPLPALELLVRTFRESFERVFVIRPPATGELILLGARRPLDLGEVLPRAGRLAGEAPGLFPSMNLEEPLDLLAAFLLGPEGVDGWVRSPAAQPVNEDDRPRLEVLAPAFFHAGEDLATRNLRSIRERGGRDPLPRYLPPALRTPEMRRRLAARNLRLGDFWEARAIVEGDSTPEGAALRAEAEREIRAVEAALAAPEPPGGER